MNAVESIVLGMLCLAGAAQGADLPVKYLEYVESTGEQYVDTGYVPNNNTRIVADFQLVQLGQAQNYVFGEYKIIGSITYGRCQFSPGAQMFVGCGGGSKTKTIAWEEDTDWHTVALTNDTVWLDGDSVYKGEGIGGSATSLYLFANNGSGTASNFATNRIGLVRIYNSGTIQRLMVPCEMSDGRVGFWDFVGGTFYGNAVVGGTNFVGGPEVASPLERLEYVKFASGAYMNTDIVPKNHEIAIRFRDEKSAAGGYLFGGTVNNKWLYSFWSSGSAWTWGYTNGTDTRSGGVYSANVDHTVVYNDVQDGNVLMDGLSIGKAVDAEPTGKFVLCRRYQTANYEGRIYWVKVTARVERTLTLWLEPMRILGLVGFYNPEAGKFLLQSAGTLTPGPMQAGQFEIAAERGVEVKGMSPACGLYENLAAGQEIEMSAPAETLVAPELKVTVTGWKLYEWSDEAMDWVYNADRANASGTGASFTYVHTGVATKLVWQSSLSNPSAAGGELYVAEFGDDGADGTSWETAKLSVGAAFDALGTEGGKVCVNAGTYWLSAGLVLDRAITLVGICDANGKRPTLDGKTSYRTLKLTSADARAENLKLYRGYAHSGGNANNGGGGLNMSAGTVVNCEFADCYSAGEVAGGSVTLTGGTLSRCSVHGGYTVNGNGNGSGAYVNGANAIVEHCLFYGNSQASPRQGSTTKIGAVYLNAGTVRNCTIVNNNMGKAGGIYVAKGAKFGCSTKSGTDMTDLRVGLPLDVA